METVKFEVEHTDTFGGEANYCWVHRYEIEMPENATDKQIKRAGKKAAGFTGHPGTWDDLGDNFAFHPRGLNQIIFVNWKESA